jgi:hypothetical protein
MVRAYCRASIENSPALQRWDSGVHLPDKSRAILGRSGKTSSAVKYPLSIRHPPPQMTKLL